MSRCLQSIGARVRTAAEQQIGPQGLAGMVILFAHGDDVHVETLGERGYGRGPMTRDTLFRMASISKPIVTVAALTLIDEGAIDLDDPLTVLLPELAARVVMRDMEGPLEDTVPAERQPVVRDLLAYTMGIGGIGAMFNPDREWPIKRADRELHLMSFSPPSPDGQPAPDVWLERFATLPLMCQPGSRWLYHTGSQVLGVLIARAAGMSLPDALRERVLEPLGMRDTGFWTEDTNRLATLYHRTDAGVEMLDPPDGMWSRSPNFPDAASGLVSSPDDLLGFSRMLLARGGGLVSEELMTSMTTDQTTPELRAAGGLLPGFFDDKGWGWTLAVYHDGAFGWDGGHGLSWLVDPAQEVVVMVMSQRLFEQPITPQFHRDLQAIVRDGLVAERS